MCSVSLFFASVILNGHGYIIFVAQLCWIIANFVHSSFARLILIRSFWMWSADAFENVGVKKIRFCCVLWDDTLCSYTIISAVLYVYSRYFRITFITWSIRYSGSIFNCINYHHNRLLSNNFSIFFWKKDNKCIPYEAFWRPIVLYGVAVKAASIITLLQFIQKFWKPYFYFSKCVAISASYMNYKRSWNVLKSQPIYFMAFVDNPHLKFNSLQFPKLDLIKFLMHLFQPS